MPTKYIYIVLVLLLPIATWGQKSLSLADAIRIGLKNNFDAKIAALDVEMASNNRKTGVPERIPTIDLNLRQNNKVSLDNSPVSFTSGDYSYGTLSGSIDLDWVLFDGFQVRINKERLQKIEALSQGNSQLVIENATIAIILAYYQAQVEQEKLKVISAITKLSKTKLQAAQNKLRYGDLSQYEYYNLKNATLADSIHYCEQDIAYQTALVQLQFLLGWKEKKELQLSDPLQFSSTNYKIATLRRQLIKTNKDIKNQYLHLALAENNTSLMRAQRKPIFRVRSGIGEEMLTYKERNAERSGGGTFDFYVNFSLSFNLVDGGAAKGAIEQAKIDALITNQEVEQMKTKLSEQLHIHYEKYHRSQKIVSLKQELANNLEKNLDLAKDRYEAGISLFIEYRDLQIQLLQANYDLLETLFDLKLTELEIMRLTGGITNYRK